MTREKFERKIFELGCTGNMLFSGGDDNKTAQLLKADGTPLLVSDIAGLNGAAYRHYSINRNGFDIEVKDETINVKKSPGIYASILYTEAGKGEHFWERGQLALYPNGMEYVHARASSKGYIIAFKNGGMVKDGAFNLMSVDDAHGYSLIREDSHILETPHYWNVSGGDVLQMGQNRIYEEGMLFDGFENLFRAAFDCGEVSRIEDDSLGGIDKRKVIENKKPTFFIKPQDIANMKAIAKRGLISEEFLKSVEKEYSHANDILQRIAKGEDVDTSNEIIHPQLEQILEWCEKNHVKVSEIPSVVEGKIDKVNKIISEKWDEIIALLKRLNPWGEIMHSGHKDWSNTQTMSIRLGGEINKLLVNAAYRLNPEGAISPLHTFSVIVPTGDAIMVPYVIKYIVALYSEDDGGVEFPEF